MGGRLEQQKHVRLADYFVVIGFRADPRKPGIGRGVILQRFPIRDWEEVPFILEIELFCQPKGWRLALESEEPKYFVSALTDMNGNRHYCACLSFHEAVALTPSKSVDEQEESFEGTKDSNCSPVRQSPSSSTSTPSPTNPTHHHVVKYAPKCLVIMSRLYQIETFRQCLGTIYTAYSESLVGVRLESLVGNLLGHVHIPLCGGQQLQFSLGGGDRQALQMPMLSSIPVSNSTVSQLFQQLGINSVLILFCAVMTEHKILFHSSCISRLTDACHALTCLIFPFSYSHVYVPILPSSITEVVCSPTPYIIGVHSNARHECTDFLMDVIVADLDGGSVAVPDGISIPTLPTLLWSQMQEQLSLVLHPELASADFAFPPLGIKSSTTTPCQVDNEIRAGFLRMFAQLFQGYRFCLIIIRIYPKPVITFHKAKFLGKRGMCDNEFVIRLLDCMFFNQFISDRGYPWRPCDIWDDLYNYLEDQLRQEAKEPKLVLSHIHELAKLLLQNQNPSPTPFVPKNIKPSEFSHLRKHTSAFPQLDAITVTQVINEGVTKHLNTTQCQSVRYSPRLVPMGPKAVGLIDLRKLQLVDKLVLCSELSNYIIGVKPELNSQQFDMVVKLMHCALQDVSVMDEHSVAAALLPLACELYRKLCTNVKQFAYTMIQEHPVWKNQQFCESVFYTEVEKEIKKLYVPQPEVPSFYNASIRPPPQSPRQPEYAALAIAAEQLRTMSGLSQEKLKSYNTIEESTIVAQAVHFISRMTYMLVPLDTTPTRRHQERSNGHGHYHGQDEDRSSNITSIAESDSFGGESGFEEQDPYTEAGGHVKRFVTRFIDKVCTEGGAAEGYIRRIHLMVRTCVDMHIEDCENVYKETKRLPPVQKPTIPTPNLLPGEQLVMDSLRVYLLLDGREDALGGPVIIPAEGALFFTNYRLIFRGTPCDSYACEQQVTRSFPVSSLTKEKRITVQYLAHLGQLLQEGLQLCSATFQLMKLAFDEEVSSDSIDTFHKLLNKYRHPNDIWHYFAFAGQLCNTMNTAKDKNTTLKGVTKKPIQATAKRVGIKTKHSKRQKYVLRTWAQGNGGTLPASTKYLSSTPTSPNRLSTNSREHNFDGDDRSLSEEEDFPSPSLNSAHYHTVVNDTKSLERLMERTYYKDWKRIGLGILLPKLIGSASFRISFANSVYAMCRSYPALVVVPNLVNDESIKKVARRYRGGRFPVITWRHPMTRALLIRGAAFNSKGLLAFFKGHAHATGAGVVTDATAHVEHENFLRALVNATSLGVVKPGVPAWSLSESEGTLSLCYVYFN